MSLDLSGWSNWFVGDPSLDQFDAFDPRVADSGVGFEADQPFFDRLNLQLPDDSAWLRSVINPSVFDDLSFSTVPGAVGMTPALENLLADPFNARILDSVFVDDQGRFVDSAGQPLSLTTQNEVNALLGRVGMAASPASADQFGTIDPELIPRAANDIEAAVRGGSKDPGLFDRVNDLLGTKLGQFLGTALLGGAGFGLSRALAGGTPTLKLPTPAPPNPIFQSGQSALLNALRAPGDPLLSGTSGSEDLQNAFRFGLSGHLSLNDLLARQAAREGVTNAEQAPLERAVRLGSLNELPGLLAPTENLKDALATGRLLSRNAQNVLSSPITPVTDPVEAALQSQILRVLNGEWSNTALDDKHTRELQQLDLEMARNWGVDWKNTTAGQRNLQLLQQRQQAEKEADRLNVLGTMLPQQGQRAQFNLQFPLQARATALGMLLGPEQARAQQAETARSTGLGERASLLTLGRQPLSTLTTALNQEVPIQPLLGLEDSAASRARADQITTQTALANFGALNQSRADLSTGINRLFGSLAGSLQPQPTLKSLLGG